MLTYNDVKFMTLAIVESQKSSCCSQKIGAVIAMPINGELTLVSEGYNGAVGRSGYRIDCCAVNRSLLNTEGKLTSINRPLHSEWSDRNEIHSEMAAILNAQKKGIVLKYATLYTTQSPCNQCAKHIGFIAAYEGISRVVYLDKYDRGGDKWEKHLIARGIEVVEFDKSKLDFINLDKLVFNNNE
ncbi:dCMP deaminase [Pectobacterium phage POP12]|nr:dCMP deaminase [Pectobacterium phage POP12]